jgi:hypothetical protein
MTAGEMIREVYLQLAKPTYLRPYAAGTEVIDMASSGATDILSWINRGYKKVCSWKFPNGRVLRFRSTEKEAYFHGVTVEDTAVAGTASTITFPVAVSAIVNRYQRWVVTLTAGTGSGQSRTIVSYSALRVATVHKAWDVIPDATTTFKLTKNFYDFVPDTHVLADDNIAISPISGIISVAKIRDMEDDVLLSRANRTHVFTNVDSVLSDPSLYKDNDGGVIFNYPVQDERYYELKYYGYPEALFAEDDEPQIPEIFHEAILLWAIWWGLRQMQEWSGAYSTKKDLEDSISSAVQQYELSADMEDIGFRIEGDY